MLISKRVLQNVIQAGLEEGADFCEIYAEESLAYKVLRKSQQTEYLCGRDMGVGIRLFYNQHELYTHTNILDEAHLIQAVRNLAVLKKRPPTKHFTQEDPFRTPFIQNFPRYYKESHLEQKRNILQKLDAELRSSNSLVSQCILSFKGVQKTVLVANSEGLLLQDIRPYQYFSSAVIAENQGQKEMGSHAMGLSDQPESFFKEDDLRKAVLQTGKTALNNLSADMAPAGVFPVIINKGFGGVIFHEACGHGMETTSVAEKLSVFSDKMGKQVANSCVNAYDDGTLKGHYGFLNTDDEGQPAQKTTLIEKGILKNYMTDKLGSQKTSYKITGSARRENYKYPPTSRMRNTYIAPGDSSLEEMVKDIDYGLFAETLGGGSVTPETGSYNFSVNSARLIKNGKLDKYVKGASLIGNGLDTLSKITKVGSDLELSPGHCGSVSGWVPVTVGQPPILVSQLTVGGRADSAVKSDAKKAK